MPGRRTVYVGSASWPAAHLVLILVFAGAVSASGDAAQGRKGRRWLPTRRKRSKELGGCTGNLLHRPVHRRRRLIAGPGYPADLTHVLESGGGNLLVGRLGLKAPQHRDVTAHGSQG